MKPIEIKKLISARTAYNTGLTEKTAILFDGVTYMFKPAVLDSNGNFQKTSESEYIGSHIYQILGIPAHDTLLATYKGRTGVLCKDFLVNSPDDLILYEFGAIAKDYFIKEGLSSPDLSHEKTSLLQVLQVLGQADLLEEVRNEAHDRFWQMFVIDSLIENYDRHIGNWGYIFNKNTDSISLAPVYDCAASLNPQHSDDDISEILKLDKGKMLYRLEFGYQSSAIRNDNPNTKMTLDHVLFDLKESGCIKAILEIVPKIEEMMPSLAEMINSIETLSSERQDYIKETLQYRQRNILFPAYQKLIETGFKDS